MPHRKRSSIDKYWLSSWPYSDPIISKVFTKNEFKFISQNFHLNHVTTGTTGRLTKLEPIINICKGFSDVVVSPSAISIDESMIPWKGRHSSKFMINGKPIPEGFKVFNCCCPHTGYCISQYFEDKSYEENDKICHIFNLLLAFVKQTQCCVFADNWFTTMGLISFLLGIGIYFCGTIRSNRITKEVLQTHLDKRTI